MNNPKLGIGNAMPAIVAAICCWPRAAISFPFLNALRQISEDHPDCLRARPSAIGCLCRECMDSMAWDKASIPVAAVISGGRLIVSSGSKIAVFGIR